MDFEKLHYPISSKDADFVLCEGKKYEVIRKNDGVISENLIDDENIFSIVSNGKLSISIPSTFYNKSHKIKISDSITNTFLEYIQDSNENKFYFEKIIGENFNNTIFDIIVKAKNTIMKTKNILASELTALKKVGMVQPDIRNYSISKYKNSIYLIGGSIPQDPNTSLTQVNLLPLENIYISEDLKTKFISNNGTKRRNHYSCTFEDSIFSVGGRDYSSDTTKFSRYDILTDTDSLLKDFTSATSRSTPMTINKLIYVQDSNSGSSRISQYDILTNTWSFVSTNDSFGYVASGICYDQKNTIYHVARNQAYNVASFDTITQTFTIGTAYPGSDINYLDFAHTKAEFFDGFMYILADKSLLRYNPQTGDWVNILTHNLSTSGVRMLAIENGICLSYLNEIYLIY